MFYFFLNNLFLFCDAPEAYQFGPQDPATAVAEAVTSGASLLPDGVRDVV